MISMHADESAAQWSMIAQGNRAEEPARCFWYGEWGPGVVLMGQSWRCGCAVGSVLWPW